MADDRKSVLLPPEVWQNLRKISDQQEIAMVHLIRRWAQAELIQMDLKKATRDQKVEAA